MLHVICDRDVGLFALILSVISHVEWAFRERRIPVVYYERGNCYWTPHGYRDRDNVWEYYFEPVISEYPASSIPRHIRELISVKPPVSTELGHFADEFTFVSNHPAGQIQFGERVKDRSSNSAMSYDRGRARLSENTLSRGITLWKKLSVFFMKT